MKAHIYLYDSLCNALKQGLQISALNTSGRILDTQVAAAMAAEWGARLAWGKPTGPNVFEVTIDDHSGTWAPFHAGDLNGDPGVRVDAVIYPMPTTPCSGRPPSTYGGVAPYIARQHSWDENEKNGARRLVAAYGRLATLDADEIEDMLDRWEVALEELGIPADLIKQTLRRSLSA